MSESGKHLFYSAGALAGRKLAKAKWIWRAITDDKSRSQKAEFQVGKEIQQKIRQNLGCTEQGRAGELIKQTGNELVKKLKKREYPFTFQLLQDDEVNAFAVPGGFVFVNSSLVEFCEYDKDETAFVLAHETGHIVRGHALERVLSKIAASTAIKAGTISGSVGGLVRKAGIKFLQSSYSRYQEREADVFAVKLMQAAGFRTDKAIEFLQKLKDSKQNGGSFDIGKYFSTHPEFEQRIKTIRDTLQS